MNEPAAHIWTGDDLTDDEFAAITLLLRESRQFDLDQYKDRCIRRRIARRLRSCKVVDVASYLKRLEMDRDELDTLRQPSPFMSPSFFVTRTPTGFSNRRFYRTSAAAREQQGGPS